MLDTFEVNKVLIIAPLRVARDTWPAEIEKWDHLKGLDISVIVGDVKTRIAAVHHPAMIYENGHARRIHDHKLEALVRMERKTSTFVVSNLEKAGQRPRREKSGAKQCGTGGAEPLRYP